MTLGKHKNANTHALQTPLALSTQSEHTTAVEVSRKTEPWF
jgi:hypothetical protein